jgi:hypothetical protein
MSNSGSSSSLRVGCVRDFIEWLLPEGPVLGPITCASASAYGASNIIAATPPSLAPRLSTYNVSTPHILVSQTRADSSSEMANRGNFGFQNNSSQTLGHNGSNQNPNANQFANNAQPGGTYDNSNQLARNPQPGGAYSNPSQFGNMAQHGGAFNNSNQLANNAQHGGAYNAQSSMGMMPQNSRTCESARSSRKNTANQISSHTQCEQPGRLQSRHELRAEL